MSRQKIYNCSSCDGYGKARLKKKDGTFFDGLECVMCKGTGIEHIALPCLECGKPWRVPIDSNEANGVFNMFCPTGDCEDKYVWKQ
jgi:hypothetical protein